VTYDAIKASILLMLKIFNEKQPLTTNKILIEDISNTLYLVKHVLKRNIGNLADKYLDFRVDNISRLGLKSRDIVRIISNMINNRLIVKTDVGFQVAVKGLEILNNYQKTPLNEFLKDVETILNYILENFSLGDIDKIAKDLYRGEVEKRETAASAVTQKILMEIKK